MKSFFTIITPSIQRDSLVRCCESVSNQTFRDWRHVVIVDCEDFNLPLVAKIAHPQRVIVKCDHPHRDGGNTCRHNAYAFADSEYVYYVDDDNYVANDEVFQNVHDALVGSGNPKWGIFPIIRLGQLFYSDPPRSCHTDTMNFVLKHEIAQWPKTDAYGSDGVVVEDLKERGVPYAAFPDFQPIAVLPTISFCK